MLLILVFSSWKSNQDERLSTGQFSGFLRVKDWSMTSELKCWNRRTTEKCLSDRRAVLIVQKLCSRLRSQK